MSQIGLPFDWSGQGMEGAFLVSDANRIAVRHLEGWRDWKVQTSILSGPPKSGRSTLARQFQALSEGRVIDQAEEVGDEALFHAWNRAQLDRRPLLLIADRPPAEWSVTLPDLQSRLAAAPHVRIEAPDEALVHGLIEQGLAAAGTAWAPDVPDFLTRRIERSYAVVAAVIDELNRASVSSGRKISIGLSKEVLQSVGLLPIIDGDPAS